MKKLTLACLSLILVTFGCGDITRSGPGRPPAPPIAPAPRVGEESEGQGGERAKITFAEVNERIFSMKCAGCHGRTGGFTIQSFDGAMSQVVPGNPEASDLYRRVADGTMPPRGNALSGEEVQIIRQWIEDGAPET